MENDQETTTQEVDTPGGWLITHHTRTWDTRTPLTQIDEKISVAETALAAAQKIVDDLKAKKTTYQTEINEAKIAEDEARANDPNYKPPTP